MTSLPRPSLRNARPGISSRSVRSERLAVGVEVAAARSVATVGVVDLAEVVVEARDLEPLAVRASPCASEARLSSAVPHSTAFLPPAFIAMLPPMHEASAEVGSTANTKPARSAASATRWVTTPASVQIVGTGRRRRRAARRISTSLIASSFSVLMTALDQRQRNRAAGVAGAAAARDDGQAELDAALDQAGHLVLGVRRQHDERILDAPVGRVGHVRDARQAVELDVVLGGVAAPARAAARWRRSASLAEAARRSRRRPARARLQQLADAARRARRRHRPACGASRPRPGGGAAPRSAARRRFGLSSRSSCR